MTGNSLIALSLLDAAIVRGIHALTFFRNEHSINNGDYLKVFTSTLLHVKDSVYICKILGKMFELQEEFQILRFGHNNGNVDSYGWLVSHHMLDGAINDLNFLLQVAMPTLKVVQATGEEPSQESQVDSILEDLS